MTMVICKDHDEQWHRVSRYGVHSVRTLCGLTISNPRTENSRVIPTPACGECFF